MADASRLVGCLLGSAVGDSIGLPSEGMPRAAIARRWPGPLRPLRNLAFLAVVLAHGLWRMGCACRR